MKRRSERDDGSDAGGRNNIEDEKNEQKDATRSEEWKKEGQGDGGGVGGVGGDFEKTMLLRRGNANDSVASGFWDDGSVQTHTSTNASSLPRAYKMPFQYGPRSRRGASVSAVGEGNGGNAEMPDTSSSSSSSSFIAHDQHAWPTFTERLASAAALPLALLFVPQIRENAIHIANGNAHLLSALPYRGYLLGLVGNLLLFSYFANRRERSAAFNQALGVVSTSIVIMQLCTAGFVPRPLALAIAGINMLGIILPMHRMRIQTRADSGSNRHAGHEGGGMVWRIWEVALLGVGALTLVHVSGTWISSMTAVVALGAFARTRQLPRVPIATVYGWMATLLFMLMPLPQLIHNLVVAFASTSSSSGGIIGARSPPPVSSLTVILALVGNALMVPRAMAVGDMPWLVGSTWGMLVMGLLQLVSIGTVTSQPRLMCAIALVSATYLAAAVLGQQRYRRDTAQLQ